MLKKQIDVGFFGMNQDIINHLINSLLAYEIKNLRLNSTKDSNSLELTTEKSLLELHLRGFDQAVNDPEYFKDISIEGTIIGYAVLNQYLVLFTVAEDNLCYIYRGEISNNNFNFILLFEGNLNFNVNNRIETLAVYENEKVLKVYWIDGVNQPRVINIARTWLRSNNECWGYGDYAEYDDPFSFVLKFNIDSTKNSISVTKEYVGGLFHAGVVQYAYSFYKLNALETAIAGYTPLNYITHSDRGELPNKQLGCSFNITIRIAEENLEDFDYVRVYSIYRTSINGNPAVKVIKDISCSLILTETGENYGTVQFIDDNLVGYDVDPYILLLNKYIIEPNAIAQKDNTLFLGNYKLEYDVPDLSEEKFYQGILCTLDNKNIIIGENKQQLYPYKNQMGGKDQNDSQSITTFKYLETYRLGVLLLDDYGNWTTPIYLGEHLVDNPPTLDDSDTTDIKIKLPTFETSILTLKTWLNNEFGQEFDLNKYKNIRPVVAYKNPNERDILCQGVVSPTVFNITERHLGTCYALSSWFFRPEEDKSFDELGYSLSNFTTGDLLGNTIRRKKSYTQSEHYHPLLSSDNPGGEIQMMHYRATNRRRASGFEGGTVKEAFIYMLEDFVCNDEHTTMLYPHIYFNGGQVGGNSFIYSEWQRESGTWYHPSQTSNYFSKYHHEGATIERQIEDLEGRNFYAFLPDSAENTSLEIYLYKKISLGDLFYYVAYNYTDRDFEVPYITPDTQYVSNFNPSNQDYNALRIVFNSSDFNDDGDVMVTNLSSIPLNLELTVDFTGSEINIFFEKCFFNRYDGNGFHHPVISYMDSDDNIKHVALNGDWGDFYKLHEINNSEPMRLPLSSTYKVTVDGVEGPITQCTLSARGNKYIRFLEESQSNYQISNNSSNAASIVRDVRIYKQTDRLCIEKIKFKVIRENNKWQLMYQIKGFIERDLDYLYYLKQLGGDFTNYYPYHEEFDETDGTKWHIFNLDTDAVYLKTDITADLIAGITTEEGKSVYNNFYYVDSSTVTLNSPDLEFNTAVQNADFSLYKTRIIGAIPLTSSVGNYNIIADSPLFYNTLEIKDDDKTYYYRSKYLTDGFYKNKVASFYKDEGVRYISDDEYIGSYIDNGGRVLSALACWFDDLAKLWYVKDVGGSDTWNHNMYETSYYVYPWNRQYLNNYSETDLFPYRRVDDTEYTGTISDKFEITNEPNNSRIIRKVLANLRSSFNTKYFSLADLFTLGVLNDLYSLTLLENKVKYFNYTEKQLLKLTDSKFYYGNVDLLVTPTGGFTSIGWYGDEDDKHQFDKVYKDGYPIIVGYTLGDGVETRNKLLSLINLLDSMKIMNNKDEYITGDDYPPSPSDASRDPILIRYKSANHAVFLLDNYPDTPDLGTYYHKILPTIIPSNSSDDPQTVDYGTLWWADDNVQGYALYLIALDINLKIGHDKITPSYLWLCEIYKDHNSTPTLFDRLNWTFTPCGDICEFKEDLGGVLKWTEGDTYYQRYDCLKTYPFSNDDYQSVVEVLSFMVETYVNLDGRYDLNRGLTDNTILTPLNFNLRNDVYDLKNNFFNANILDYKRFNVDTFPTRLTWSLPKQNGQDIDEWTRVMLAATMDVDGDKGEITALRKLNNEIICFQNSGISKINYNEKVALSTDKGVPIELGNSARVTGKEYISETIGSLNKWSCIVADNTLLWVDNNTGGIYTVSKEGITSLTKDVLLKWFDKNNVNGEFIDIVSYDANMNEVLFTYDKGNNKESLAYSLNNKAFTSFYDYKGWIDNLLNHSFNITDNKIYALREGSDFNKFYDEDTKPFYITFTVTPNNQARDQYLKVKTLTSDCILDNVWYRMDTYHNELYKNPLNDDDFIPDMMENGSIPSHTPYGNYRNDNSTEWFDTFDRIRVGNDYQFTSDIEIKDDLRAFKKFRLWRVPIPRLGKHGARIRNPWTRIKLEKRNPTEYKSIFRDIMIDAYY